MEELAGFPGNGNAMPPPEAMMLKQAISQLRKVVALEQRIELTTEYLVELENALGAAERAVRAERWAREVYEFQGE